MLTRTRDTKAIKATHIGQVHGAKRVIEAAAFTILNRQFRDAAAELREVGVAKQSAIFRPRDWHQRVRGACGPAIARVMLLGAASELIRHKRLKPRKSSASDYLADLDIDIEGDDPLGFATEMPQELIDSIEATLYDSFQRPYWDNISGTTANQIEGILRRGSTEGLSVRDMAHELVNAGEMLSRTRALTIARTESSRSLNSGHLLGIQQVERDTGEALGKSWISIMGTTTRESHAAADGQTVATTEPFIVGGHECMFPGDADLPVSETANCQCTLISAAGDVEE